tara:strand:+ start:135 stop:941 length:807 start_codon:yes stop_codon:yes gene_type:complete
MSPYVTKEMAKNAILKMKLFHEKMKDLYMDFEIDMLANSGRRNVIMSHAQEKFFAEALASSFPNTESDGATGKADIIIPEISRELECKLTSGSGKYSSFELQTDWATLVRKKSIDYLYVLTSKDFNQFAVLFFDQLTPDDFFPPATGSRGKSRMNKASGMKKCTVLMGNITTKNEIELNKLQEKIIAAHKEKSDRISEIKNNLNCISKNALKKRENTLGVLQRETYRLNKKIQKLSEKVEYWENTAPKFKFQLSPIFIGDGTTRANTR